MHVGIHGTSSLPLGHTAFFHERGAVDHTQLLWRPTRPATRTHMHTLCLQGSCWPEGWGSPALPLTLVRTWEIAGKGQNLQKWLGEGAKGLLGPREQRSPKSLLHHQKPSFAPVQPHFAPVQEASCALGPKDLFHPPLATFGDFPFFGPFPRSVASQR